MKKIKNTIDALKIIHSFDSLAIKKQQEENARLKDEVERLRASSFVTAVPVEQYERLLKAGDRMAAALNGEYNHELPCVEEWNAAKEGKPSV